MKEEMADEELLEAVIRFEKRNQVDTSEKHENAVRVCADI